MRITFTSFGTRGDVQPALALAKALVLHGHQVQMVAGSSFAPWLRQHGVEPLASAIDIQAIMRSDLGRDWIEYGHNPIRQAAIMRAIYSDTSWQMALDIWHGSQGGDLLISSFTSDLFAASVAEKLAIRHLSIALQPAMIATRSGAAVMYAPYAKRDSILNYWVSKLFMERGLWQLCHTTNDRLRREILHLPPISFAHYRSKFAQTMVLHGYSRHVLPQPADWPATFHTVGYWFLQEESDWQPTPELLRFLTAGVPPVYIGFGSMTGRAPQKFTRLLIDAVQRSGQRAVLLSGWAGIGDTPLPASILRIEAAPHEWLFPRMVATVHHGGAGTTAASLRAGTPTVVVPHIAEQPLWGKRVELLGVGPKAIPRHKLSAEKLASAISEAVTDRAIKQRTMALSAKIRSEDGIGTALRLIENTTTDAENNR